MKNTILMSIATLVLSFNSYGQCKTNNDPITNEKIVSFETNFRERTLLNSIKIELKKAEIKLDLSILYKGLSDVVLPSGTEIVVKLKNDEILKLKTSISASPKLLNDYSGAYSTYSYVVILTKEEVTKIANQGAILVRFPDLKSGNLDLEKAAKMLTKATKCISEGM